jgi:hypothetical protein
LESGREIVRGGGEYEYEYEYENEHEDEDHAIAAGDTTGRWRGLGTRASRPFAWVGESV